MLGDLGYNLSLDISDRSPVHGALLNRKDFGAALSAVNWTVEMKDGRVPTVTESKDKHKLGGWTAEDLSKFIIVAPVVLRGLIPKAAYESICLLNQMHSLIFSKRLRVQGWSPEHTHMLKALLWRHNILYEELYGLSACTENVEYSCHMIEDIIRHGPLDNYWCFMYERKVKYYKQQTTNMKSMCKTFADREVQLQFVTAYLATNSSQSTTDTFDISVFSKEPLLLRASSSEAAIKMKECIENDNRCSHLEQALEETGIVIGGGEYIILTKQQQNDIIYWLQQSGNQYTAELGTSCLSFSRMLKKTDSGVATVFCKLFF